MKEHILIVDDDLLLLHSYERSFRQELPLITASSGPEALRRIAAGQQCAVIVSDMHMPGMSGLELLERVQKLAPDMVRMVLTGAGDFKMAVDAINKGSVFRFLEKPCPPEVLKRALVEGVAKFRLASAKPRVATAPAPPQELQVPQPPEAGSVWLKQFDQQRAISSYAQILPDDPDPIVSIYL